MVNLFPHAFNLDIAFATSNLGPFFKNFESYGIYYKCYILVKLTPEKESCVCIFQVPSSKYLKKLWQQNSSPINCQILQRKCSLSPSLIFLDANF